MPLVRLALCAGALVATVSGHHPHDVVTAVGVSPAYAQDRTLFVAINGSLNLFLMSRDGGYTWRQRRSGLRGSRISAIELASDWAESGTAWVAMEDVGIQMTTDSGATWQPPGIRRPVLELAVSSVGPAGAVAMFHATAWELFASDDRGATDRRLSLPLGGALVVAVAISPTYWTDRTVVVSTSNQQILVSRDGGATWATHSTPATVHHIALSPGFAVDRTLWCASWGRGVLRSTDGGASFEPCGPGLSDPTVNEVAVLPAVGGAAGGRDGPCQEVFAATQKEGVFRSVDGGRTWSRTALSANLTSQSTNHYYIMRATADGLGSRTLFCGMFEGLYLSDDGGAVWRESNVNPTRCGRLIEFSPDFAQDRTVFAAGYGMHALISNDGGTAWRLNWEFPCWSVYSIGVSPDFASDRTVLLGASKFFVRSTDAGSTWEYVPLPGSRDPKLWFNPWHIAYSPTFARPDRTAFAISYSGLLWRSDDGGKDWARVGSQPIAARTTMVDLSTDFAHDHTVFVAGDGLFRSTDGGQSFARLLPDYIQHGGLLVAPDFDETRELYVLSEQQGFVRLTDGGEAWTASNDGLDGFLPARIRPSPDFADDDTLWVATFGGGLFRSTDRGRSWSRITSLPSPVDAALCFAVSPDFARDGTLFVGGFDGFYRSRDGGAHWQLVTDFEFYDDFREPWAFRGKWARSRAPGCHSIEVNTSTVAGDSAELPFEGSGVRLIGTRGPDHGIAEVWLDGRWLCRVDGYAPATTEPEVVFERDDLPLRHHVLEVRVTGLRNAASTGTAVAIDGARIALR